MHEVVVVHYHRGWRAALFYFLDVLAVLLAIFAVWAVYEFYKAPAIDSPAPAEHITLPDSGQQIKLQTI